MERSKPLASEWSGTLVGTFVECLLDNSAVACVAAGVTCLLWTGYSALAYCIFVKAFGFCVDISKRGGMTEVFMSFLLCCASVFSPILVLILETVIFVSSYLQACVMIGLFLFPPYVLCVVVRALTRVRSRLLLNVAPAHGRPMTGRLSCPVCGERFATAMTRCDQCWENISGLHG